MLYHHKVASQNIEVLLRNIIIHRPCGSRSRFTHTHKYIFIQSVQRLFRIKKGALSRTLILLAATPTCFNVMNKTNSITQDRNVISMTKEFFMRLFLWDVSCWLHRLLFSWVFSSGLYICLFAIFFSSLPTERCEAIRLSRRPSLRGYMYFHTDVQNKWSVDRIRKEPITPVRRFLKDIHIYLFLTITFFIIIIKHIDSLKCEKQGLLFNLIYLFYFTCFAQQNIVIMFLT